MSKPEYAVEVKNVKKSFYLPNHKNNSLKQAITQAFKKKDKGGDSFDALKDISFNVEKGDFFGVLGRNGSGKSTLLKIISDIYQPSSGSVKHNGKLVAFIELGVGFKAELSGRDNVYLNGALLGFSKKEIEAMYDEIVEFAELEMFMDQKLKNYSSGMKVRLAFSVAIRAKADILILDEVLAVGDASFQKKCYDYFKELKDAHKTIIFVSHSMGLVKQYCNRAILIEDGRITQEGDAGKVADSYQELFEKPVDIKESKVSTLSNIDTGSINLNILSSDVSKEKIKLVLGVTNCQNDKIPVDIILDMFRLHGKRKTRIGGTSVFLSHKKAINISADDDNKKIEFLVDNILGNGDIVIDITIKHAVSREVLYSSHNFHSFTINESKSSYLPVILPCEVST